MRKKVMIVDDDELILAIYGNMLQSLGCKVTTRNSPLGTTAAILADNPDIVLLDVFMPTLSGNKVVEVIKSNERFRNIKVLLFSSRPIEELADKVASCGADGFIQKTGDHQEFVRQVKSFL